jgi:hypothetical protein
MKNFEQFTSYNIRGLFTTCDLWFPFIPSLHPFHLGPGVYLACNRNEYQEQEYNVSGE